LIDYQTRAQDFSPNTNQTQAAISVHCRHPATQCIVNGDDSAVFRFLSLATLTFDLGI